MLVFASICPHPPIVIPTIGGLESQKVKNTINAMVDLADKIKESKAETIVIISPHSPVDFNMISLGKENHFFGNFANFDDLSTSLEFESDNNLKQEIVKNIKNIRLAKFNPLDHGVLVPLVYLTKELKDIKLVPISYSMQSLEKNYEFGKSLSKVIKKGKQRIAIIASGDLSHCLTPDAPSGYSPKGKEFDDLLVNLIEDNNIKEILNIDDKLIEEAAQCGLRSIAILLGSLSDRRYQTEVLSYEGPLGVGYLVANYKLL